MLPLDTVKHLESHNTDIAETFVDLTRARAAAIPDGMQIQDLEKYSEHRFNYRAKFESKYIGDFCAYVTDNASTEIEERAQCFIDRERMQAKAIFDIGTPKQPGHCRHTAHLDMPATPEYRALLVKMDAVITQEEMAEFIEDYGEYIKAFEDFGGDKPMELSKAISAIRVISFQEHKADLSEVQSFSVTRSAAESLDINSKGQQLPALFGFTLTPYEGLDEVTFVMRLKVRFHGDKKPSLMLSPIRLFETQDLISTNFYETLEELTGGQADIYLGNMST